MKCPISQVNYYLPNSVQIVDGELPVGKYPVLMLIAAFLSLALYTINSSANIRIESDTFSVDVDTTTLESQLEQIGPLVVTVGKLERINAVTKVQLVVTNPTNSIVPVTPIHITIGNSLSREQDTGGGFGASFFTYLNPFIVDESGLVRTDTFNATRDSASPYNDPDSDNEMPEIHDWFGWTNRYHFEAIRFTDDSSFPRKRRSDRVALDVPESRRYRLTSTESGELNPENLFVEFAQKNLNPGEALSIRFDHLSAVKTRQFLGNPEIKLEGLLLNKLWGWLRSLCFLIWDLLDFLYGIFADWGIAIILLALVIRVITIPITRYSLRHQERAIKQQAQIKPLLQEIKQNYSGAQQSEKIVELYESQNYEHLAPFKSMLGLFIQIPIFVALFNVLGDAWEVSGQSFLWITDLAQSDRLFNWGVNIPYFGSYFNLLPVIMAAITILSTWLASRHSGSQDTTTTTLFGMGAVFFVLFYSFPAALVLYWLSSNVFQLI